MINHLNLILHFIQTYAMWKNPSGALSPGEKYRCSEINWISRANAQQRQALAGHLQEGICYRLYSRAREANFVARLVQRNVFSRAPLAQQVSLTPSSTLRLREGCSFFSNHLGTIGGSVCPIQYGAA